MIIHARPTSLRSNNGSALAATVILTTVMAGMAAVVLTIATSGKKEQRQEREDIRARAVAQAGVSAAMFNLQRGVSGAIASAQAPLTWGNAQYYVTQEFLSPDVISLKSTGLEDRAGARMELVLRAVPSTIWMYGAFGKEHLHMSSNSRVDSYNSNGGTYVSQATNGTGTNNHAHSDGDIGSNGNISLSQNAKVWGNASSGPDHTTTVLGNAFVTGSTTPMSAVLELPALSLPSYPSLGALSVNANTTIPSGTRRYTNLTVKNNKTLTITGPAEIVITNLELQSGSAMRINATAGPVTLWVIDDFIMRSNALLAPTDLKSKNLKVNLLSDNVINPEVNIDVDDVTFASNTQLYGMVYAPSAAITINSNFELFGSVIARSVDLNSNASFHFDEALIAATAAGAVQYETLCVRDLPYPTN